MSATHSSTRDPDEVGLHEIRIQGHLDTHWTDWLEGLTFTHEADGTTTLRGPLEDQAALHGVLNKIRDLALPIVSVRRMNRPSAPNDTEAMTSTTNEEMNG
jgi:hypothetical protein